MVDTVIFFGSLFVTITLTGSIFIFGILIFWGVTELCDKIVKKIGANRQ